MFNLLNKKQQHYIIYFNHITRRYLLFKIASKYYTMLYNIISLEHRPKIKTQKTSGTEMLMMMTMIMIKS